MILIIVGEGEKMSGCLEVRQRISEQKIARSNDSLLKKTLDFGREMAKTIARLVSKEIKTKALFHCPGKCFD